ncbi:methyltransferase domain-containing protein [Streptomyces sp. NPDC050315]|uniref:class I SAM-dependent methyltransferase n=1 Tax=Streptomyces sp. NPDC050315 TaxID=3155039 RepID=UPI003413736E
MTRIRLAARAMCLAWSKSHADPTADYDAVSGDYDTYFSPVMGRHSLEALAEVPVRPGDTAVELACGTGHLTAEIVRRMEGRGTVLAVDKSPGMLAVARAKIQPLVSATDGLRVELSEGDMEIFLRGMPPSSVDLVVVGWAICYSKPPRLLADVERVLRPGGWVVVIETRADAHQTLTEHLQQVFGDDPSLLANLMRVSLPKNAAALARWFAQAGLAVAVQRDGTQTIPAHNPEEVMEWVQRSGAAAGFKNTVAPGREQQVLDQIRAGLAGTLARERTLNLHHTFVVVTGSKPASQRTAAVGMRTEETSA